MSVRHSLLCAILFVIVSLAVEWRSLAYEWHWDDLHLVRLYSAQEIAGAFTGTWDPDGVETKGLRPLTVLFNHARAWMFGEWTLGHRLLLVGLFSAYLVMLASLACRFGAPWWIGLAAGVVTLSAKNSFYHVVWIADGIHLVPALLFVVAAHSLLTYLDSGRQVMAALSAACLLLALSAREDALALYGIALLLGMAYLWFHDRPWEHYARMVRYGGLLIVTFLPFWTWRLAVVPSAPNFRVNLGVLTGPPIMFDWTVCLSGQTGVAPWMFRLAFLALVGIAWHLPRDERRHSFLWLILAAIACIPGAVIARTNLLLFPISFYALFVLITMAGLARRSRTVAACVVVVMTLAVGVSMRASQLEQLSVHAMSYDKIFHDWFGLYSTKAFSSIPHERRQRVQDSLAALGIVDGSFDFPQWERELRRRNRVGFIDDGQPFMPAQRFLAP